MRFEGMFDSLENHGSWGFDPRGEIVCKDISHSFDHQHKSRCDGGSVPKSCPKAMRNAVGREMHTAPRNVPSLANPSRSSNDITKRQLSVLWVPNITDIRGRELCWISRETLSTRVLAHWLKEVSVSALVRYTGGVSSGEAGVREPEATSWSWYAPRTNLTPSA